MAVSGIRPASVPVTQKVWPCRCMGWWSMGLMFTMRMRTRLPRRTSRGVIYGADRPLSVNQLNSIDVTLGMVLSGRMAHSWIIKAKS